MRKIGLAVVFALALTGPVSAQTVGYSIDVDTREVSTFSCDEGGDPACFVDRTVIGTIAIASPNATALAPTGELVVLDRTNWRMVWFGLPSLEIQSSLVLDPGVPDIWDIAYGPDGALWAASGSSLLIIDQTTGEATEIRDSGSILGTIAFVGDRLFAGENFGTRLLEIDPVTGDERLVANYYTPGPYGGVSTIVGELTAYDGRLWSLSYVPPYPPAPYVAMSLGSHHLETGEHLVVHPLFGSSSNPDSWWTLDVVETPEQQPPAIPAAGGYGLATIVVLIGLAGVLVVRRVF